MKKNAPLFSLRVLLLLLVGLLVGVALVLATRDLQRSWVIYRDAGRLAERNLIADACVQAVQNFAFERGRSHVLLRAPQPISRESRDFIDAHRAGAQMHIAAVLARLDALTHDGKTTDAVAQGEQLRRAWRRISTLRGALDRDFPLALAARDPLLADQWMFAADDLMRRLEALLIEISDFPGEVDARFERLSALRTLVLHFRNQLGSENTRFAVALSSGGAPRLEAVDQARLLRGGTTQLWAQLDAGLQRLADAPSSEALAKLRAELIHRLRPMQDRIIAGKAGAGAAAVDGSRYLAASVATLNASAGLADAINEAIATHTRARLEEARREALLSAASIVAILLLGGLVVIVLVRRFARPLNDVMTRIDTLLVGQPGLADGAVPSFSGDEFSRVDQALEFLDEVLAARARSEAALNESERMSALILACVPMSIIAIDRQGLITLFSRGAQNMLGYDAAEMVGRQTPLMLHDNDELRQRAEALSRELGRVVTPDSDLLLSMSGAGVKQEAQEWTYVRKDGSRLTVLLVTTILRNAQGDIDGCLGVATDVTERTLAAAEIVRMAHHDQLTRLPNRRLFHDRMQVAMNQVRREGGRLALMLIDLDGFKPVNDRFGHPVGDLLLKAVATRMQGCLRESDTLARVGGDEFAVILPRVGEAGDALVVAEKILRELNAPFELDGDQPLSISGSVGVAIYPEHGDDEKHLAKNADEAMYVAKAAGGNRACLFSGSEPAAGGAEAGELLRLVWENGFECGEPLIDQAHHELFDLANGLIAAVAAGAPEAARLPALLDGFLAGMARHFAEEEAFLARRHYGGLAEHALAHAHLLDNALDLRQRADAGDSTVGALVTFLAHDVVVSHMLEDDLMFVSLFDEPGRPDAAADHALSR